MSQPIEAERIEHALAPVIEVLPAEMADEITAALAAVPAGEITAENMAAADEAGPELHRLEKAIESRRKELTAPINSLKKEIDGVCKRVAGPVKEARTAMNRRIGAYNTKAERERQELIRKQEERQRQEAAAREAAAAEAVDDDGLFGGFEDEPEAPEPCPFTDPTPPPPAPVSKSVVMKTVKRLEITDEAAVPKKYWTLNRVQLERDLRNEIAVPGARLVEEQVAAQRGSR